MEISRLFATVTADIGDFERKMSRVGKDAQKAAQAVRVESERVGRTTFGAGIKSGLAGLASVTGGNLLSGAIGTALGGVTSALQSALSTGIEFNKQIETANVRLSRFFGGGAQETSAFVDQIRKFADASPVFELPQALTGAQRLLQMKFAASQVPAALANIADIVGGIGGNVETIDRVTLALGQMVGKGRIQAEEMEQLAEAGVPAWELLAKAIGKTEAETRKLSEAGRINAKRGVEGILAAGGDTFAGQSSRAGNTLSGLQSQFNSQLTTQLGASTQGAFEQLKQGYAKAAEGLATTGAAKFAGEINNLLTDAAKTMEAEVERLASGAAFQAAANTLGQTNAAIAAVRQGNAGGALSAGGRAVESFSQATTGQPALKIDIGKEGVLGTGLGAGKTLFDSSKFFGLGAGASKSIADGVASGADAAKTASEKVAAGVESGIRDPLQQHSPSLVMEGLGRDAASSFLDMYEGTFENGKKRLLTQSEQLVAELKRQYERARKEFGGAFDEASKKTGIPADLLMGVASRETNMRNIVGDGGRGAGVMQVDIGTDAAFKASGAWKDATASIIRGAEVLKEKFDQLISLAGEQVSIRSRAGERFKFEVPKLSGEKLTQTAVASYNTGLFAARSVSLGRSPDASTTPGASGRRDYSEDVLRRASIFQQFREGAGKLAEAAPKLTEAARAILPPILDLGTKLAQVVNVSPARQSPRSGQTIAGGGASVDIIAPRFDPIPTQQMSAEFQKLDMSTKLARAAVAQLPPVMSAAASETEKLKFHIGDYADALQQAGSKFGTAAERFTGFQERVGQGFDNLIGAFITGSDRWQDVARNIATDFFNTMASEMMLAATGGKHDSLGSLLGASLGGLFKPVFSDKKGGIFGTPDFNPNAKQSANPGASNPLTIGIKAVADRVMEGATKVKDAVTSTGTKSVAELMKLSTSNAAMAACGCPPEVEPQKGPSLLGSILGAVVGAVGAGFSGGGGGGSESGSGFSGAPAGGYITGAHGVPMRRKAAGGLVTGPGGPTSDSVPTMLSAGEFVVRAATVKKVGVAALERLNKMATMAKGGLVEGLNAIMPVPHYAQGGLVTAGAGGIGKVFNISINVPINAPAGSVTPQTRQQVATETARALQFAMSRNG